MNGVFIILLYFFYKSEKPKLYNFGCQQGLMVLSNYTLKISYCRFGTHFEVKHTKHCEYLCYTKPR